MEPLVSVIVPVFNVASYLREALDSLVNQTYQNLEILIIDDGSNDGSGVICDEYQESDLRIRVFHQENQGLSAARNVGLDHMMGEYVVFFDPDDVMIPKMIETVLNTMIEKMVRVVTFGCFWYHNGKVASSPADGYYDRKDALRSYVTKKGIAGAVWTKVFEATLFKDIRFREGHNYADVEVFFRVLDKCETLYAIHEPLFSYRKRSNSITATDSVENRVDSLEQNRWLIEYASQMNVDGALNDVVDKLKTISVRIMLASYYKLYYDHSKESEIIKQSAVSEVVQRIGKIPYNQIVMKLAATVFIISPKLFVFLCKVYVKLFLNNTQ